MHSGAVGEVRDLRSAPGARRGRRHVESRELVLAAERTAPRAARHWAMRTIASVGVHGMPNQVVELLVGEVVANAVVHGPGGAEIRVLVEVDPGSVRVEVTDAGPGRPEVLHPEPTAPSGRGMALVESLSSSWGVHPLGRSGKTVWFIVEQDPD